MTAALCVSISFANEYQAIFRNIWSTFKRIIQTAVISQTLYSGVKIQDDGTMRIFDTIDDSLDAKRETVSLSQSKFKIQKNKDLYVNKGKGNVSGGGSFGRTKSLIVLTTTEDGFSEYTKTETTSTAVRPTVDSYSLGGKKTSASNESGTTSSEYTYSYSRIGDEQE